MRSSWRLVQIDDGSAFGRREQPVCLIVGQRFDVAQLAGDRRALAAGFVEGPSDLVEPILRAREDFAETAELGLDGAEHAPHFGRPLLDRERAEAELQAVQHGDQIRRSGERHAEFALQRFGEAGSRDGLGKQSLGGHEQDREIGRMRRLDVLVADRARLNLEELLERPAARLDRLRVGALHRVLQSMPVLQRKFSVDRQPAGGAIVGAAGKAHRVFDTLLRSWTRRDVLRVLRRRQHVGEQ
jgi:hypothetical protein